MSNSVVSGKHEFKIFQQYGYLSDSTAVGLQLDSLTALVVIGYWCYIDRWNTEVTSDIS